LIFAVSVVSLPMILDRQTDTISAGLGAKAFIALICLSSCGNAIAAMRGLVATGPRHERQSIHEFECLPPCRGGEICRFSQCIAPSTGCSSIESWYFVPWAQGGCELKVRAAVVDRQTIVVPGH